MSADIAVASMMSGNVLVYSDAGEYRGVFAEVTGPNGLAVGEGGDVFVSHGGITRYAPDGTKLAHWTGGGAGPLAIGPDGNLYLAVFGADRIDRFDVSDGSITGLGHFVTPGLGGLNGPTDLAFGPDDNLYVTSRISGEVLRYDGASGAFVDVFAISGGNDAESLTFGPDGNLYVFNGGVRRYDGQTGEFDRVVAKPDVISQGDIGFGPDGHLYVGGRNYYSALPARQNQIDRFDGGTGQFLNKVIQNPFTESGPLDDFPLNWPAQFAWGEFGLQQPPAADQLMIGIAENRLLSFDPVRGRISEVHAVLPGEFTNPAGFEVDAERERFLVFGRSGDLLAIDANSLDVDLIGRAEFRELVVPSSTFGRLRGRVNNVALDPATNTLYTMVTYSDFHQDRKAELTELVTIDLETAEPTVLGKVADGMLISQIGWNAADGTLVGTLSKGGLDSKTSIVSIDPNSLSVTNLFETSYGVHGMAPHRTEPNRFTAWVNDSGVHYAEINLAEGAIELLGNAQSVGVSKFQALTIDVSSQPQSVPEPNSATLVLCAIIGLGYGRSRRSL